KKWATSGWSRAIFGGWTLSGIYAWRSGRPYTVNQSNNNVGTNMTGLPNQVGDPDSGVNRSCDSPTNCPAVVRWFDPKAFQAVASGIFGSEHRNLFRGPDWSSLDLSLQRRIDVSSRVGAILRWDVFNVFNPTNFAPHAPSGRRPRWAPPPGRPAPGGSCSSRCGCSSSRRIVLGPARGARRAGPLLSSPVMSHPRIGNAPVSWAVYEADRWNPPYAT